MNILVTYQLNAPGQNYPELHQELERYRNCKPMRSVWLLKVASDKDAVRRIRDQLKRHITPNDVLLVCEIDDWAAINMKECGQFLNS